MVKDIGTGCIRYTVLVRGHNPQAYVPADADNCINNELLYFKPETIEKFVLIAQDAKNGLLNSI